MQKEKIKTQKGITLIALIITIIVMLILVGVSVTVALNGGLFNKAKEAAEGTQTELEREQLIEIAMGTLKNGGTVNYEELKSILETGNKFTVSGNATDGYVYTSTKTGKQYTVTQYGSVEDYTVNEPEEPEEPEEISWTKTSSGALAVGSTVKASNGEEFYVIGFTEDDKAKLLAKQNIGNDQILCSSSVYGPGNVESGDDLNSKSSIQEDDKSAVYTARQYAKSLGLNENDGRLMTVAEARGLQEGTDKEKEILYGPEGHRLNYWLGTASSFISVYVVQGDFVGGIWIGPEGSQTFVEPDPIYTADTYSTYGVRPVIVISKNSIS